MTALDTKFRALATRLIDKNGKSVTFTSVKGLVYDTETRIAHNASHPVTVKALVEDYSLIGSGTTFQEGLVSGGDKKFSLAAAELTVKPKPGDSITLDTVVWNIVRVTEIWSGEQISLFECQARI